jgi:hypothetical protein
LARTLDISRSLSYRILAFQLLAAMNKAQMKVRISIC